jgi:hypothetical protein
MHTHVPSDWLPGRANAGSSRALTKRRTLFGSSTASSAARQLQNTLPGCMYGYEGNVQFPMDQAPMRQPKLSHPTNQTRCVYMRACDSETN